ncbi:XRE family transcriptional regulator [Microbaculum marinum]|uniref:XRE family transcriptional regulator n=1 Tax=Microbaculum marinum TaxID=1764581 RepID=A0AAW9RVM3_9HYPH
MNIDIKEPGGALSGNPKVLEVGAKLQQLRRERSWTLHEASRATGISVSTLSKIEREALSPTVTTLSRIATGFGIEAATLLTDDSGGATGRRSITRSDDGKLSPTGTCDNVWLCSDLAQKKMAPIRTRVRARDISEYSEWARYNAEVFVTVLSGTLVVHSDIYAPVVLNEGDSMYYDANAGHVWTSEGEQDAVVLWVHTQ